ncbi:MAG: adenylyltransferase/cytidyltransferase family protein [Rickettsiales bacterium]|jgi:glycerol-3-phosphate cytidylyltransferase|nr:adenylyltransferase/cytidyltransferase family protein [Rickettsiales bacterium]
MKIGVVCGSWDLMHHGHLSLIRRARKKCDWLIVGVNSDARIKSSKNKSPIWREDHRLEIVRELRSVDEAYIIKNGLELIRMLIARGINVSEYYRGDDGIDSPEQKKENVILEQIGVRPVYFSHTPEISSTILQDRIKTGGK